MGRFMNENMGGEAAFSDSGSLNSALLSSSHGASRNSVIIAVNYGSIIT